MDGKLLEIIEKIKSEKISPQLDEAATKQTVILRILNSLGWDIFEPEEVYPEYPVNGIKVDYSLRSNNKDRVFIEAKKIGEDLEKHQEQLLRYSFKMGVDLAILTNGITWWFYLPLKSGEWEKRKYYSIDIYGQDADEITDKFIDFLLKENVITGESVKRAEDVYKGKIKEKEIKETLPKAWNKILDDPDETLVELVAETTEKLCGYRPDDKLVEKFVITHIQKKLTPIKKEPDEKKRKEYVGNESLYNILDTNKRKIVDELEYFILNLDEDIQRDYEKTHIAYKYKRVSWIVLRKARHGIRLWIRVDPLTFSDNKNMFKRVEKRGTAQTHGNYVSVISQSDINEYLFSILRDSYTFRKSSNYSKRWGELLDELY
ncbi:DUF5655 domain-containing protein [Methanococcoides sp. NM1]|uniref:DUF5655 domain-containing protein n=1 Tax=Methanococcoides sp. NM1 TaxID=1201013 RepID=UPI001083E96E|nr:DUF5655 domain-containing protein [Methanococcoides sp. NM1]